MSHQEQIKVKYATKFLSKLTNLRGSGWKCDYHINAGSKIFLVHRAVLAAFSNVLKDMLEMEELEKIDLPISEDAAVQFVNFIYSGEAAVTNDNCKDLLLMADTFESQELKDLCFFFLDNVTHENCFLVRRLRKDHDLHEKVREVDKFIIHNFFSIRNSLGFLSLTKEELARFLQEASLNSHDLWDAIVTWITFDQETRKVHLAEFLSSHLKMFTVHYMIEHILTNSLMAASDTCRKLVLSEVLSSTERVRSAITEQNFLFFAYLSEDYEHSNSIHVQDMVTKFIGRNFRVVVNTESMKELSAETLTRLLKSPETAKIPGKSKWEFLLKWTKHDISEREKFFPQLFSMIDLGSLAGDYIRDVVCNEYLVKNSDVCNGLVKEAVFHQWKTGASEDGSNAACKNDTVSQSPAKKPRMSSGASTSKEEQTSTKPDLKESKSIVVYRRDCGKLLGINIKSKEKSVFSQPKPKTDSFQSIAQVKGTLYLMRGAELKSYTVQEDKKNTWATCNRLRRDPGKSARMVTCEGRLFIVEKYRHANVCNLATYDPETNSWTDDEMPLVKGSHFCVCADDDHVYIIGGNQAPRRTISYDPIHQTTAKLVGNTIYPRINSAAASLRDKIYVLGGSENDKASRSMEFSVLGFSRAIWSLITSNMQCPRWDFAACAYRNKIYAVGGKKHSARLTDSVEVFDEAHEKEWQHFEQIPKLDAPFSVCIVKLPVHKTVKKPTTSHEATKQT